VLTAGRLAVPLLALVLLAVTARATAHLPLTTYVGDRQVLLVLLAVATVALFLPPMLAPARGRFAVLAVLALTWPVPELAGWSLAPLELRTLAQAAPPVVAALAVVAVLPAGPSKPRARSIVRLVLLGALTAAGAELVLVDPFLDPRCWRTCDHNPFLVASWQGAGRALQVAGTVLVAGGAVAAVCLSCCRAGRPSGGRVAREGVATLLCTAALLSGTAGAAVLRLVVRERADSPAYVLLFVLAQLGATGWALSELRAPVRQWWLGVRLRRLAGAVRSSPPPGSLAQVLRRALRDPALEVLYWAPGREAYVDPAGHPATPPRNRDGRRTTLVARQGQPVAALVHAPGLDGASLDRTLGAALTLALANEQLRAANLAELDELRSSSVRIVERAELERRRLERNLHDGAQQRLVSLALLVRMLSVQSQDVRAVQLAERAALLTRLAVDELRRVARGIYPAVLSDGGLAAALLDVAESSVDLAIQLRSVPQGRYSRTVETTAYLVVAAAAQDARSGQAGTLRIFGEERAGALHLELLDDSACDRTAAVRALDDQVRALSGVLDVERCSDGTVVRLRLPCAS